MVGEVARYTRFVGVTKIALGLMALALIAAIILLPLLRPEEGGLRIAFSGIEQGKAPGEKPKMLKPHFQGTDEKNQPYNVSADAAVQEDTDKVSLARPKADIALSDGRWLALTADRGALDMAAHTLELTGSVHVFYDEGYEFTTEHVTADIKQGIAAGNQPVAGQGPVGTLQAKGFTATGKGDNIHFTGPVRVVIYPGEKR